MSRLRLVLQQSNSVTVGTMEGSVQHSRGNQEISALNPDNQRKKNASSTGTLGKAMSVLDIVASSPTPPRFTDILRRSDQPRGTLHRQLQNLVEEGLLSQRRDSSYELGVKLLQFAARAWSVNEFRTVAEPHLRELHALTGETVHLGVLRDNQVIYVDKVEGNQSVRMHSQIGNASPVYCTGVGKAALSAMPDVECELIISQMKFHRFTDNTIVSKQMLREEISEIRELGFAFDLEEHEPGIHCVAAPVFSLDRSLFAGVSVTAPTFRVTKNQLEDWSAPVCEAVSRIMTDMRTQMSPRA